MIACKVFVQLLASILVSTFGYLAVIVAVVVFEQFSIEYGRTTIVMLTLLMGYPLGSVAGVVLANRYVLGEAAWQALPIVLAVVLGCLGGVVSVLLLFTHEEFMPLLSVGLTSVFSVLGYNLPSLFPVRKRRRM